MATKPARPAKKTMVSRKKHYPDTPPQNILTDRGVGVLALALVIGIAAGFLGYLADRNLAAAVLTGGAALGGTLALLLRLLE